MSDRQLYSGKINGLCGSICSAGRFLVASTPCVLRIACMKTDRNKMGVFLGG